MQVIRCSIHPTQRDLMTADEMRRKSNELAILIIEGENAVKDEKYNMKNHPNYYMIAEGENLTRKKEPAKIYDWGSTAQSKGHMQSISRIDAADRDKIVKLEDIEADSVVMTEEELFERLAA